MAKRDLTLAFFQNLYSFTHFQRDAVLVLAVKVVYGCSDNVTMRINLGHILELYKNMTECLSSISTTSHNITIIEIIDRRGEFLQ